MWRVIASHGNDDAQNSAFLYLWIIAEVVRTCYTLTWDIKMDWGLIDRNAGENRFLREEIVYPRKVWCLLVVSGLSSIHSSLYCYTVASNTELSLAESGLHDGQ